MEVNKPHLFYNNGPRCKDLIRKINEYKMEDEFIYHDVADPNVQQRLPKSYTSVPLLFIKGFSSALIGKEVFNWVEMNNCINLDSIDVTTARNPDFYFDPSIGKPVQGNFSAIKDEDDKKMAPTSMYLEDVDKMVTQNMNKRFIDKKVSEKVHQEKLQQLMTNRNDDLQNILNENKLF